MKADKELFQEIMQRPIRTGTVQGVAQDSKILRIVSMFETQRREMEKELIWLR